MEMIRAQLNNVTNTTAPLMTFEGTGKVGESVGGKLFRHFGFTAVPPPGTTMLLLQEGNNCYSVAENNTTISLGTVSGKDQTGSSYLYNSKGYLVGVETGNDSGSSEGIFISNPDKTWEISFVPAKNIIQITTPNTQVDIAENAIGSTPQIKILANIGNNNLCGTVINTDGLGTVGINNNLNTSFQTGVLPKLPLANQNLVTALAAFMTTTASATTAAQIAAAAGVFLSYVLANTPVTQAVKGA